MAITARNDGLMINFSYKIAMLHFQQPSHDCLDNKLLMISSSFINHVKIIRSDKFNFFYGKQKTGGAESGAHA